jgi:phosphatidate cytidylyltransferase
MTKKMKNFIVRTVTGVLFVVVMVAGFLRPMAMIFLFALITGLTVWEFAGLVNASRRVQVNQFISTVAGVYFFLAVAGFCTGMTQVTVFIPYLITIIYLIVAELFTKAQNPINNWAYTALSQMYIALPFSMINALAFTTAEGGELAFNNLLPLSVFVFLWANDTGAYCTGSLIGKHKLMERVSPGKTWEGSAGGAVLTLIVAALVGYFSAKWTGEDAMPALMGVPQWIGLGLVVVVTGTLGDLVESLMKRTLGVKDSGNVLPGHGGMLDRFDSSLMAIPSAVVYVYTLTLI